MPLPVTRAVQDHLRLEGEIGGYAAEVQAEADLEDFYEAFAALLNCSPQDIAFVENATRAWDMAFYGIDFRPGDRIVTCTAEYASNFVAFLQVARSKGVVIDVAADDDSGQVSVADIERLIRPETKLIAVTHIPTQGGLTNPVEAIGRVARAHGILFLLDACQSLGQCSMDVQRIGCDFLSSTGRKFLRGPRGTGVLYVRKDALGRVEPPFVDAHAADWRTADDYRRRDDARRFETWEWHVAGKIGLAKAVRYALDLGLEPIWERVRQLSGRLRDQLGADPNVEVADLGSTKCGIVTFRRHDEDPSDTLARLSAARVQGWQSTIEWARLDFERRGIQKLVRLSVHYFNTDEEIDRACRIALRRT